MFACNIVKIIENDFLIYIYNYKINYFIENKILQSLVYCKIIIVFIKIILLLDQLK